MAIPFLPFPLKTAERLSKVFYGISENLSKFFPFLKNDIMRSDLAVDAKVYLSVVIFSTLFYFLISNAAITSVAFLSNILSAKTVATSIIFSFIFSATVFVYQIMYPRLLVKKKTAEIEKNLLHALRHLLIEVRSGVPLFDAMVAISQSRYGKVSDEFKKFVREVNGGTSEIDALNNMSLRITSLFFQRVIWQIMNGLRAGSDISIVLKEIVSTLGNEQKIQIRRYGSQLNPLALVYMMCAVILPSLGITFLIILSSFSGMLTQSIELMFYLVLIFLLVFQFMFLGLIKSRRPNII